MASTTRERLELPSQTTALIGIAMPSKECRSPGNFLAKNFPVTTQCDLIHGQTSILCFKINGRSESQPPSRARMCYFCRQRQNGIRASQADERFKQAVRHDQKWRRCFRRLDRKCNGSPIFRLWPREAIFIPTPHTTHTTRNEG